MDSNKSHYGATEQTHVTQPSNVTSALNQESETRDDCKTDKNTSQRIRVSFSNIGLENNGSHTPARSSLVENTLSKSLPSLIDSRAHNDENLHNEMSRTRSMINLNSAPTDKDTCIHTSVNTNEELCNDMYPVCSTTNDMAELRDETSQIHTATNDIEELRDRMSCNHARTSINYSDCEECFESDFTYDVSADTSSLRERLSRFSLSSLLTPRRRGYTRIPKTGTLVTDSFANECVCCCVIL